MENNPIFPEFENNRALYALISIVYSMAKYIYCKHESEKRVRDDVGRDEDPSSDSAGWRARLYV